MNATLITWMTFIGVFGGAAIYWWVNGGYKTYLKYKSGYKKEKARLEKSEDKDEKEE